MPAKRKSTTNLTSKQPTAKLRKISKNEDEKLKNTISELKKIETKKVHNIDSKFQRLPNQKYRVHGEFDCVLNKTNIQQNNNKYYIIQLIIVEKQPPEYIVWTRWGRVGEPGQSAALGPFSDLNQAKKTFEKKFRDKAGNNWGKNYRPVPGKYTLVDVVDTDSTEVPVAVSVESGTDTDFAASKLDQTTQTLIRRIFDNSMFEYTMKQMNLDVKKMPLGKLSARQIATALEVLEELGDVLKGKKKGDLEEISSRFYTVMPHCFGRQRPPAIRTQQELRAKLDMLLVLSDVNVAQELQKGQKAGKSAQKKKPNPLDEKYDLLKCDIVPLNKTDGDRKLIEEYFDNTGHTGYNILNVWKVNRSGEAVRFKPHDKMGNHQLLWHGTSVAVVAAILSSGLRIMPHAGGLVGRGLYFASQAAKSQGYGMSDRDGHRIMFLVEVALGKEHHIHRPDGTLVKAPAGYDSVVAVGQLETDPKKNKKLKFENNMVIIPYGKPDKREVNSTFYHSEYLIYDESQARLRYVIEYKPR